ncbi:MAG: helix-turn-helix transcriptional regulator [Promethearchaeota archaeon]|jgi:predicted DNA-binding transcriptional regulator AlpA
MKYYKYQMITADDFAEILSCSKRTIWRLRDENLIPKGFKLGQLVRWRLKDIDNWLNKSLTIPEDLELDPEQVISNAKATIKSSQYA